MAHAECDVARICRAMQRGFLRVDELFFRMNRRERVESFTTRVTTSYWVRAGMIRKTITPNTYSLQTMS